MTKELSTCKKCKSDYFTATSTIKELCPNCAHFLHGHKKCYHRFENGERCTKCYWNGAVSEFVTSIVQRNNKKLESAQKNIIYASILLGIALLLTFFRADLGIIGIIVCVPYLVRAKGYKKRLEKEIPYLD